MSEQVGFSPGSGKIIPDRTITDPTRARYLSLSLTFYHKTLVNLVIRRSYKRLWYCTVHSVQCTVHLGVVFLCLAPLSTFLFDKSGFRQIAARSDFFAYFVRYVTDTLQFRSHILGKVNISVSLVNNLSNLSRILYNQI